MIVHSAGSLDPTVSICIPTLDGQGERLWECENAIARHTDPVQIEVVTADCQGVLLGYTKPMALAMAAASGKILVALNDDVRVSEGWLEPLVEALQAGAWCATPDGDQDGPALPFAPHCMAWTTDAWREIGGLDRQFRHWASDIDLARRLIDAGHPPVLLRLPNPVIHSVGSSSAGRPQIAAMCQEDLRRYEAKWGISAEEDKHRMAAIVRFG